MVFHAVGLPNVGEFGHAAVLVDLARCAEESGWDGVYVWDHVLYRDQSWPVASPVVSAAAIAARTTRIRIVLMTAVPRRRPWVVARELATLDVLSGGRLVAGVALGSIDLEYSAFGESPDLRERAAKLDEAIAFLPAALTGEPVSWRGADPVRMSPARAGVPIWGTGRWPRRPGFRRSARLDGMLLTFSDGPRGGNVPPPSFDAAVAFLREQRGGTLDGFDVAVEGESEPGQRVDAYAGLTWWIEAMGWWRGGVDAARTRIAAGP